MLFLANTNLTRPSALTVLLKYTNLFNQSDNIKQTYITLTEETLFNALLQYHPYNELPYVCTWLMCK